MDKSNLEYRSMHLEGVTVDSDAKTITGRAIVYNKMSNELRTASGEKFYETILPNAVDHSMSNNDIMAYKEHNPEMILGRKSAGTLKLEQRSDGLYVSIDVPNTGYGRDTLESAKRGDIKSFSFGFSKPTTRNYTKDNMKIREISNMDLREISVVSNPAYNDTTLNVRSEDWIEDKEPTERSVVIADALNKIKDMMEKKDDSKDYEYRHKLIELQHNKNFYAEANLVLRK